MKGLIKTLSSQRPGDKAKSLYFIANAGSYINYFICTIASVSDYMCQVKCKTSGSFCTIVCESTAAMLASK